MVKKFDDIFNRFDTIPACDGQIIIVGFVSTYKDDQQPLQYSKF